MEYKPSNHCYYDTNSGAFKDYPSNEHTRWTAKLNNIRAETNKIAIARISSHIKNKTRTPKNVKKAIILVSNAID